MLTPETMNLLESGKKDVGKDKDGENVPKLEFAEVVFSVPCNLVKNDYQNTSKVLFTFLPNNNLVINKSFTTFFNDYEHNQY